MRMSETSLKEARQGAMWICESRKLQPERAPSTEVLRSKCDGMLENQPGCKEAGEGPRRARLVDEVRGAMRRQQITSALIDHMRTWISL